jgi:hypothetical protein
VLGMLSYHSGILLSSSLEDLLPMLQKINQENVVEFVLFEHINDQVVARKKLNTMVKKGLDKLAKTQK